MNVSEPAESKFKPQSERIELLDAIRGVAIVGVVFGHVVRGLFAADIIDPSDPFFSSLDRTLYLVRMPLFALLAGTLIPGSVTRRGFRRFAITRSEIIAYQFLVWTAIQGSIEVATSSVKNVPVTWTEVLNIAHPLAPLWFLPFVLLASIVAAVIQPWKSVGRLAAGVTAAGALSVLTWSAMPNVIFVAGLPLIVFVVVGAGLSVAPLVRAIEGTNIFRLSAFGVVGGVATVLIGFNLEPLTPTGFVESRTPLGILFGVVGTAVGVVAAVILIGVIHRVAPSVGATFGYLGRHSIHIFLVHVIFTAGVRVALGVVGIESSVVHLVAGMLAGILGPLALERLVRHHFPLLFAPPWRAAGRPVKLKLEND